MTTKEKIEGCYWGVALGDALGMPVEFKDLSAIIKKYGSLGIQDPPKEAIWTDDTQMTIALTQALIKLGDPTSVVKFSDDSIGTTIAEQFIEWLADPGHAPGKTCREAVRKLSVFGPAAWRQSGKNDSKGCGTVMRAAPVGLWFAKMVGSELDKDYGQGHSALRRISTIQSTITHGHPAATVSAIANAYSVTLAYNGVQPSKIINHVYDYCGNDSEDLQLALERAIQALERLRKKKTQDERIAIESIGEGWIAEESIAMALFAIARHPDDLKACLRLAANHRGDSDSVASIAGGILGATGISIPQDWKEKLVEGKRLETVIRSVCKILA